MSNYSVPLLIRRRWQARPVWTSPVAIALGLHALLLAVPGGFEPLHNAASLGPASRGALVDLSDQLGLPASGSTTLQPLRLPGVNSLPLPAHELPQLQAPSLPPVINPVEPVDNRADAHLITLDPASEAPQSQPLDSKPSRPSLETLLNSITSADQPLGFSPVAPSSYALDPLDADERTQWLKSLRGLAFATSWFQRPLNSWELQRPAPKDLVWPDSFRTMFRLRLSP